MGAIDTIANFQTTVNSTLAAGVMAAGDSATVRAFPPSANAKLIAAFYDDVTSPLPARIRSPLLHDNVDGIEFDPGTSAPSLLLPPYAFQQLQTQDTLIFEESTAAATGKALLALMIYYSQLPGASARLYANGDIQSLIKSIKPVRVAVGSGANTAGAWYDLALTTTENLLHANTDYAVLGITCTAAVAAIGIKGTDTGNLRVCAPGGTNNPFGSQYFSWLADHAGVPAIPVINSANAGNTYVSLISSAATGAASVISVILAELTQSLS